MSQQTVMPPLHRATLKRRDVLAFETQLLETIRSFTDFQAHSISFPRDRRPRTVKWIEEEQKLLLPLPDNKKQTLCVFMASGVKSATTPSLVEHWTGIGSLIAQNLLLHKQSACDPVTGLYSRHLLLHSIKQEISRLRSPFGGDEPTLLPERHNPLNGLIAQNTDLPGRGSCAVFVIRLSALRDVVREFGYQFADNLIIALGDALQAVCPEQSLAARTGDLEFAVHLPAAGPKACRQLAATLAAALQNVHIGHPLRNEQVGILPHIGYALYPHDMQGNAFLQPDLEQAHILLRKARLAAALAGERHMPNQNSVLPFGHILAEGGRILDVLPLSRVTVSLGLNMHAKEGQRFSVWSVCYPIQGGHQAQGALPPLYKGEIVLMEVRENTSSAEILHIGDPSWHMEPGDRLTLIPEEQSSSNHASRQSLDPVTGLLRYGDFMAKWVEEREQNATFCLTLLRISAKEPQDTEEGYPLSASANVETSLPQVVDICQEAFGRHVIGGRYGLTSLLFYHGDKKAEDILAQYEAIANEITRRLPLTVAIGIAAHPFLDYRKTDTLENCQKALEYGMLLPSPHVGVLDSIALNIAADKFYSQGDTFAAIKEYKTALMADESNCMAWNSLGICLAGLGKHPEAEACFQEALAQNANDVMALYNLGYIHQSQDNGREAKARYTACLAEDPQHLFSLVRLGQLAESEGNTKEARLFYEKAAELPGGKGLTCRHFARLCIKEGQPDKAREFLHEALIYDPQDAFAMQLMAQLFLDAGEDPDMAASFARQSVSLRPQLKAGWLELSRALEAMGEVAQAKEALLRAGEA